MNIDMKEYLVTYEITGVQKFTFIVRAKSAKDAISQVREMIAPIKSDTKCIARSIGSLHNEHGKIVRVGGI